MSHAVLDCLSVCGPRTIDELRSHLDMTRREVEEAIQAARLAGVPIIDRGRSGVALTSDPDELAAYLEKRRRRMATVHRGTLALRSTLRRMTAPTPTLWPDL